MCPKAEAVLPERALRTFPSVSEATASGAGKLTESQPSFPMPANVTHAKFERAPQALRSNARLPKKMSEAVDNSKDAAMSGMVEQTGKAAAENECFSAA